MSSTSVVSKIAISISFRISYAAHAYCTAHADTPVPRPHQLASQQYRGCGEIELRQPIRAISRNRLSSMTSEEMEARLMSRAYRV